MPEICWKQDCTMTRLSWLPNVRDAMRDFWRSSYSLAVFCSSWCWANFVSFELSEQLHNYSHRRTIAPKFVAMRSSEGCASSHRQMKFCTTASDKTYLNRAFFLLVLIWQFKWYCSVECLISETRYKLYCTGVVTRSPRRDSSWSHEWRVI